MMMMLVQEARKAVEDYRQAGRGGVSIELEAWASYRRHLCQG